MQHRKNNYERKNQPRIHINKSQVSSYKLQVEKGEEYNHPHLNPLPAYAKALADRPSRARK